MADITSDSLPDIAPTPEIEIWHDPEPTTNGPYTWWHMIVARKGALADLFDIDEVAAAYFFVGG